MFVLGVVGGGGGPCVVGVGGSGLALGLIGSGALPDLAGVLPPVFAVLVVASGMVELAAPFLGFFLLFALVGVALSVV